MTTTTTPITDVLQRARVATLRLSVRQVGTLSLDAAVLAAWKQRGWTLVQIEQAARDLAGAGVVRLRTTPDGICRITWIGGER